MTWLALGAIATAHPLVDNAMDVVVEKDRITIDARIAAEEIVLVESEVGRVSTDREWRAAVERHCARCAAAHPSGVDGHEIAGSAAFAAASKNSSAGGDSADDPAQWPMVPYRVSYSLATAPRTVEFEQDFLREFSRWKRHSRSACGARSK